MGFEIKYFYKEMSEEPGIYKDKILEKIQKIGKFDEEISLEIVAGKIISQLAKRSIFIIDVEINEYAKKKISYKETEFGILIKNKKFSFDTGACIESSEDYEEELNKILQDEALLNKIKESIGLDVGKKLNLAPKPIRKNDQAQKPKDGLLFKEENPVYLSEENKNEIDIWKNISVEQ